MSHHFSRTVLITWFMGWAIGVIGCSGANESTISGTVQLDNKPLETGTVTFHPNPDGPLVYGQIGAGGRYEAKTGSAKGLLPGEYVITIAATGPPPPDYSPPKLLTPKKYSDKGTSGLQRTVKPGHNTFDFELLSGD